MVEFVVAAVAGPELRVDHAVFIVVGLLGGAHCLGMCGPLVTMYGERLDGESDRVGWYEIRQHLLFNAGRTVSYALVGATVGVLGMLVYDAGAVAAIADGIRAVVGVAVGVGIVVAGGSYALEGAFAFPRSISGSNGLFSRVVAALEGRVDHWVSGPRIVGLGMLHGLLPCPILYPVYLYAFVRGSPVAGFVSLALVGLGTFPTLFACGTAFQSLRPETRERLYRALGVAFVVLGYLPLSMGLASVGIHVPRIEIPFYQPFG